MILEVMSVGSPVLLLGGLEGRIAAVCVFENQRVQYQCVWWSGRDRKIEWLESFEVQRMPESASSKLGFS